MSAGEVLAPLASHWSAWTGAFADARLCRGLSQAMVSGVKRDEMKHFGVCRRQVNKSNVLLLYL